MYFLISVIALTFGASTGPVDAFFDGVGFVIVVTNTTPSWQVFVDADSFELSGYEGSEIVLRHTPVETAVRYTASDFDGNPGGWGAIVPNTTIIDTGTVVIFFVPTPVDLVVYTYEDYQGGELVHREQNYVTVPYAGVIDFCVYDASKTEPGDCGCDEIDTVGCGLLADFDGDGDIDLADYQILQNNAV